MRVSDLIRMKNIWEDSPTRETYEQHPELQLYVRFVLCILLLEANRQGDGWSVDEAAACLKYFDANMTDAREADLGMAVSLDLGLLTRVPHPTDPERKVVVPTELAWRIRDQAHREWREEVEQQGGDWVEDDEYLGPPSPTPEEFREAEE